MIGRQGLNRVAATAVATMMVVGAIATASLAATVLKEGENASGHIRNSSPSYQFRNQSKPGAPTQSAHGEEYSFTAQRGDRIEISLEPENGSSLKPVLVLISPNGKQVAYDDSLNLLKYQVRIAGTYRLLVLGTDNTRGRYTLAIAGLTTPAASLPEADQVMQNELRLRVIGCGVPNVARIKIGSDERCTRDIEAGQYIYDPTNKRISLVDTRRDLLTQRLQVTVLDRCPTPTTTVAQITLTDPQDSKDYTYCAMPTRFVKAGTYRYNVATDELQPTTIAQPVPAQPVPAQPALPQTPDSRRQILQSDYGLTVLDTCPPARTSLVVVSFPESNQSYVYCAQPNRLLTAGEYTYNATTGNLDPAQKPAPACTVSVGGICLVK